MPVIETLATRVSTRLLSLRDAQLSRGLREPTGFDFCSNDYLGLSRDSRIQEHLIAGVRREGCGSTGSRLLRGERESFERVERAFAAFKRTESALYLSSGYLANIAVLTTFPEAGDIIFSDERNHASLIDGIRLSHARRVIFPHNDIGALIRLFEQHKSVGHRFVVTESLFSMEGDQPPLADYAALCESTGATLIVDEAHAVGLYGTRGSGLIEAAGVESDDVISINTAGKALGVSGAFIAGPSWAIEYLIQRARPFIFSTAPLPAIASAIEASLTIVGAEPWRREKVSRLSRHLRLGLGRAGVTVHPGESQILPIVLGENDRTIAVAEALQGLGFDVRAIRPPSVPRGTARLRVSLNAALEEATVDQFAAALAGVLEGSTRCSAVSS
jgi:8-amino-7-oxononanoate synthase